MKVLKKTFGIISFAIIAMCSCNGNTSQTDTQKIKELENEVKELKEQNKKNENDYSTQPIEVKKEIPNLIENHKYVFGKFKISYYAMSGINQDSKYEDIGITNILEMKNYTDENMYKLKDEIKRQRILLSAPFARDQRIISNFKWPTFGGAYTA